MVYKHQHVAVEYLSNSNEGLANIRAPEIVIGIHDDDRNTEKLIDTIITAADGRDPLIICPRFRTLADPIIQGLDVWTQDGWSQGDYSASGLSPFVWLDSVAHVNTTRRTTFVGHGAGADLLQRWAYTAKTKANIVLANPNTYMWHNFESTYKYGLAKLPKQFEGRAVTNRPFTLLLGMEDIDPKDTTLDTSRDAQRQGLTRRARGIQYARDHFMKETMVFSVGHMEGAMLQSSEGVKAVFGK